MEQYRFDEYGSVYEYSAKNHAYLFIGKLNGRTREQFLADYEREQYLQQLEQDAEGYA